MDSAAEPQIPHHPVLYHEIISSLRPYDGGLYVDGTVGVGGHAWGILNASSPNGRLLGMDVDPQALRYARERLKEFGSRVILVSESYTTLQRQLEILEWEAVDGVVLDLGVSSIQLDTPERGFSFRTEASLDMRFNPKQSLTAAEIVNGYSERELADLLHRYGEERRARKIAKAIIQARPIHTTRALAQLIISAVGKTTGSIHPATRSFQALRIAVNAELDSLQVVLPQAVSSLKPGGRIAVIAFHSLEDRLVKQYFRKESRDCICPADQPVCTCDHVSSIEIITRRPIRPSPEEVEHNPRARSARLRVAEKK
jgi:16S rRNA (cytosine1402-N4)-methyltransferase